jgi:heat shock protein HslJ
MMKREHARGRMSGTVATAIFFALCIWMPQRAMAQAHQALAGTTWRLVSLTMSGQTVTPDDRMKYTLSFEKNGNVLVRADCNRGKGRYTDPMGALQIDSIVLTKAHCAPGSIADQFARAIGFTQSFDVRDGSLLLGIAPGGDTLRFEPSATKGK